MVEREHSKSSTVFPESLTTNNSSLECSSNLWLLNDATPHVKPGELCSSDMLNIELLYGSVLPTNETFSSINPIGRIKENDSIFLQAISPNDILSVSDATPYDLFYNDKNMTCANDYWNSLSEKVTSVSDSYFEANSPLSFWGNCPLDVETLKMDDVFQVDKDDLVQSPTLAELNANDESLFDSFDNFDANLPLEHKSAKTSLLTPALNSSSVYKMSSLCEASKLKPSSETSSVRTNLLSNIETSCGKSDNVSEIEVKPGFNAKEIKIEPSVSVESIAAPPETRDLTSEVISKIVKKTYSANESSIKNSEEKRTETVSECAGLSSLLNQEVLDSEEDDSEMDCDYSSDVDEESDEETKGHSSKHGTAKNILLQKKKSRYFWQYNIQSKGPKAPKMKLDGKPTVSNNTSAITDPVFASNHFIKGIKHAGKARRGDGNDLTPNPLKLYNIGMELEKLTSVIEGLVPANELPLNARSKSRKEKNKLASRACRLKKKAQHEANKLKLFGLQKEQKNLLSIMTEVKKILRKSVDSVKQKRMLSNAHSKIVSLCMKKRSVEVAGCSAEFVNNVLKIVDSGDKTGGLDIETRDE